MLLLCTHMPRQSGIDATYLKFCSREMAAAEESETEKEPSCFTEHSLIMSPSRDEILLLDIHHSTLTVVAQNIISTHK